MYFTTNHDVNTISTVFERFGDGAAVFAVFSATVNGMPLIYSGQEAGLDRRLKFFEKDEIFWKNHDFTELYTTLLHLKRENRALWNGSSGGKMVRVPTSDDDSVFAFLREKDGDKVFVIVNLSGMEKNITLQGGSFGGSYTGVFTGETVILSEGRVINLKPWDYMVFEK